MDLRVAFIGDVVGKPGREMFARAVPVLRAEHGADLVIVDAENARHGRGLHPEGYDEIRGAGADAITLGDHAMDDERIGALLKNEREPLCRPVNFPSHAGHNRWVRLSHPTGAGPAVYVLTVLGRVFMPIDVEEPFESVDEAVRTVLEREGDALFIVEIHCEATSEKAAVAWHCAATWPGRVLAVLGTHTHCQTNDARILNGTTAAITDVGMCGAHEGVIGFDADSSIRRMRNEPGAQLELAEGGLAADGVILDLDLEARRPKGILAISVS